MRRALLAAVALAVAVTAWGGTSPISRRGAGTAFDPTTNTSAVTGASFTSTGDDNTHYLNVANTGAPAGATTLGDTWFDNTNKVVKVNAGADNAIYSELYRYHRIVIDAPTVADNVIFSGPLDFAQKFDNVLAVVQDNTGKLSGSAADNVTFNLSYCTDAGASSCTSVFTSDQQALGSAVLTPALNNTTPSAGNYLRFTVSAGTMTNKKLYVRVRYYKR